MPAKGKTNNPFGRPPTGVAFVEQLREALKVVEKKKKKSLIQHAVEIAYEDNTVLIAILKKLIPDQVEENNPNQENILKELLQAMTEAAKVKVAKRA